MRWDDGRERVSDVGRSDVVVIEHVRLIIPPHTEVERKPLSRVPVVLGVDPYLRVTSAQVRIAGAVFREIREREVVGRAEMEHRVAELLLHDMIAEEIHVGAELHHVRATPLQPGVGKVVAER